MGSRAVGLTFAVAAALAGACVYSARGSHLSWNDFSSFGAQPAPVGVLPGSPLERLGLKPTDLSESRESGPIRWLARSRYLNNARAVVTHTIDDSTEFIVTCLDTLDKYDIKATVFVSTEVGPISWLWPRLRQAVADGHEIGSHSRRHQCSRPDTFPSCFTTYTDYEVTGSRQDILAHTDQPYVWSWCYPCGSCAERLFVQRKLARAGYLVARPYPHEAEDGHLLPDLETYAANPYFALYTQSVQNRGGIAKSGRTGVREINAKFDEVYQRGGVYNFLSHPQWLEYGPDRFYEQHLAHIGRRQDVWYVPMGPLYAFKIVREVTEVAALEPQGAIARFVLYNNLDPKIFDNSVTLEFSLPGSARPTEVISNGRDLPEGRGLTDRWNDEYFRREGETLFVTVRPNAILEFR